ncbi:MAG TPA: nitrate reductase cytochrome c-type subunit [Planctomycetaceae bacterium]|nr:nitrate reductase cytochrome c-type subunit [Planctomycetaceae bacterium]HQZ68063.1 nitrate reductase cytochrome c-type subunit [Planctomycetaceae bacterium]
MTETKNKQIVTMICFVVISFTVVGYFTGLQAPMTGSAVTSNLSPRVADNSKSLAPDTIIATRYADMHEATRHHTTAFRTVLTDLKSKVDPFAEFTISADEKTAALQRRNENRAFNGAPPTIPHAVSETSTAACMACHAEGAKTETLRIPKMSHQFLANCTQCHVENNPRHMEASLFRESDFVGLPAPTAGPRAFAGAPPQIPHSTWMRSECMSCHGFAGLHGIRTTHPWRNNCTQCHAPSSKLDQTPLATEPRFLTPPQVE